MLPRFSDPSTDPPQLFQNQELISEVARILNELANVVSQVKVGVKLFDIPEMLQEVKSIYSSIIRDL